MRDTDFDFQQSFGLRDGRAALIRVVRPDDRERIEAAFAQLEPRTIYSRFFAYRKQLPPETLERIRHIDFEHIAGLVATIAGDQGETIIGGAGYVARVAEDGAKVAELAFTIEEDFQHQGLATHLLQALLQIARRHGIVRFEAEVLADNLPMVNLLRHCGLPQRQRREAGVTRFEIDLPTAATTRT